MAFSTLFSTPLPLYITLSGLAALTVPWFIKLPRLAIGFLFLSLVVGQLIRLPLPGQGGGLLLSDLAAVIILLSVALRLLSFPSLKTPLVTRRLTTIITPFLLWAFYSLILKASLLGPSNTLIAASYWLRLSTLLLLLPALTYLFYNQNIHKYAWRGLYFTIALLTLLGIVQLAFLPDLSPYSSAGWDPHQFRLVSTWLDPNFFGAFLSLGLMVIFIGPFIRTRHRIILSLVVVAALFATQSRSTVITLITALLLTTPLFIMFFSGTLSKKHLVFFSSTLTMFVLLTAMVATLLLPRFVGLISIDPTVQARVSSIQKALPIIENNNLLGVGYNAYQFVYRDTVGASNFQNHSRAGADNSLLTIWATTGLIGLFLFLVPWMYITQHLFTDLQKSKLLVSFLGLFCLSVIFIHSQFINSLTYSHLLITVAVIISLSLSITHQRKKSPSFTKTLH